MIELLPVELLAGLGIFIGCFGRGMFPFLKKRAQCASEGKAIQWDRRYWWTIGFSLVVAFIVTMMVLPTMQIASDWVFPNAFLIGWASEDIINRVAK